jgi:hypothetical protein
VIDLVMAVMMKKAWLNNGGVVQDAAVVWDVPLYCDLVVVELPYTTVWC